MSIPQDFVTQLLQALKQGAGFNQDLTSQLSKAEEAAFSPNPNQFNDIFDPRERGRLEQGQRNIALSSVNSIQNQLDQRNQSLGELAQSVARGRQADIDQANTDREFGLRQQQLTQQQANADRTFRLEQQRFEAEGLDVDGLTAGQRLAQQNRLTDKENELLATATDMRKQVDEQTGGPQFTEKEIAQFINKSGGSAKKFGFGLTFMRQQVTQWVADGRSKEAIVAELKDEGFRKISDFPELRTNKLDPRAAAARLANRRKKLAPAPGGQLSQEPGSTVAAPIGQQSSTDLARLLQALSSGEG